jgi:HK97 family phage portal protein
MAPMFPDRGVGSALAKIAPAPVSSPNGNGNGKHAAPSGQKAFTWSPSLFWLEGNPVYTPSDDQPLRGFTAFALSAIAFACMRYRATKLVEAPLWIAEEKDGEEDWIVGDHPLAEVLERPNPDMEMADLLELVSYYLDATQGRCLLVKNRDRAKRVISLYPYASDEFSVRSEVIDGVPRLFGRFFVNTAGGAKEYGPDDVIYLRGIDPRDPHGGLGPLNAALGHLNLGENLKRAVQSQLRNAIRPGSVTNLTAPSPLDDIEFERLKNRLVEQFAGVMNTGKNIVVENAEWTQVASDLQKLALGDVNRDVEATICMAFEIHPALIGARVGIENSASFGELLSAARELFYDRCMFPRWSWLEKAFTRSLLREVDPNPLRYIRFVKDDVHALQEDVGARVKEANGAKGFWTRNEQRVHTGKPKIDGRKDLDELQAAPDPAQVAAGRAGAPGVPPEKPEKAARARIATKSIDRAASHAHFDARARGHEATYELNALLQLGDEREWVLAQFRTGKAATPVGETKDDADTQRDLVIAAALERIRKAYGAEAEFHSAWLTRYKQLISETVQMGGSEFGASIGVSFNLTNPSVAQAIARRAKNLADSVVSTTRDAIADAAKQARSDNPTATPNEIASAVDEKVFAPKPSRARAKMISRTETVGALNEGEFLSATESGVIRSKEWMTQGDDRVRDTHRKQDGVRVALGARFENGLLHPGDDSGDDPSEICNCRCTLLYSDEEAA